MAVEKSKSFDYAQDVTKQLIALSTGVVTVTVAISSTVAPDAPGPAKTVLYCAWGLFAFAILAGILTLFNLTGHVGGADASGDKGVRDPAITVFAIVQIALFVLAMFGTIYFGIRAFDATPSTPCTVTSTKTQELPGGKKVETKTEDSCQE
jgi:hypothetical protein